jgi:hypothetical protein
MDRIEAILKELSYMSSQLTALQAQVAQNTSVEASAATLILGLASQLSAAIAAANNGDTAALPALQQELQTSANALAAAVTANTAAAPAPAPAPATGA